ncbi:MAG: hypothetical protein ACOH1J_00850, partial [Microbacteriaceae bacterium]
MIYVSCLLAAIGVADIIRARSLRPAARVLAGAAGVGAVTGLHLLVGTDFAVLAVSIAVVALWMLGTSHASFTVRQTTVFMLGLAVVAGIVRAGAVGASPDAAHTGPLVDWYEGLGSAALASVQFAQAFAVVSLAVFLLDSANVIVRVVLELPDDDQATRPMRRGRLGARRLSAAPLKGGRIIGPLERIFLFALALAGQFTAIGAIVAAKGIVRFPELSRDNNRGSNAELFLVGSFTSWAIV